MKSNQTFESNDTWTLVYSPKSDVLEELLLKVVDSLELHDVEGVETPELVEKVMIERGLLCGIIFNHEAVNFFLFQFLGKIFFIMRKYLCFFRICLNYHRIWISFCVFRVNRVLFPIR